jgi:hypothetical protein
MALITDTDASARLADFDVISAEAERRVGGAEAQPAGGAPEGAAGCAALYPPYNDEIAKIATIRGYHLDETKSLWRDSR